jgi:hypothetical protein
MKTYEIGTVRCDYPDCHAIAQVQIKVIAGVGYFPEHAGGWLCTDDKDYCPTHVPEEATQDASA